MIGPLTPSFVSAIKDEERRGAPAEAPSREKVFWPDPYSAEDLERAFQKARLVLSVTGEVDRNLSPNGLSPEMINLYEKDLPRELLENAHTLEGRTEIEQINHLAKRLGNGCLLAGEAISREVFWGEYLLSTQLDILPAFVSGETFKDEYLSNQNGLRDRIKEKTQTAMELEHGYVLERGKYMPKRHHVGPS